MSIISIRNFLKLVHFGYLISMAIYFTSESNIRNGQEVD